MRFQAFVRRFAHMSGEFDPAQGWITMYDNTDVLLLPDGPDLAYAGYVNGRWPTYAELEKHFPGHRLLDIAVTAEANATCLDIENGDANIGDAPDWVKRQIVRGVHRPVLYIEASRIKMLEQFMAVNGVPRTAWRLWSAHYTGKEHLCAPFSCGYGVTEADGTQFTDRALGLSLDQSILNPEFFDVPAKPTPPPSAQEESMLNKLPTLQEGSVDQPGHVYYVHRMQALVKVIAQVNNIAGAKDLALDGDFGPGTRDAVEAFQHHFGLTEDGVCGPATWEILVLGWSPS